MKADFLPGVSVELRTNGQALPEYVDEDNNDGDHRIVTRYVEATSNTEFSIHLHTDASFPYRFDDLNVSIRIDGQEVYCPCIYAKPHLCHIFSHFVSNINGVGHRRAFAFGELKTTDEAPAKLEGIKLKDLLSSLGEVTIALKRGKILGRHEPQSNSGQIPSQTYDSVPEKALKGRSISNRVTLKDAGTCAPIESVSFDYIYGRYSLAKFTFKYRSHRDLQIEGIIPRSPSPVLLEDLNPEDMTREQAITALLQKREREAFTARVKRERTATVVIDDDGDDDDDDDEAGVSITSAGPVKKRQRMAIKESGVEVIDLSDD